MLDGAGLGASHPSMARTILSLGEARRAVQSPGVHLLWVAEGQAKDFSEPGWIRLEPPREGGVMFLHRERQQAALQHESTPRDALEAEA